MRDIEHLTALAGSNTLLALRGGRVEAVSAGDTAGWPGRGQGVRV